MFSVGRQGDLLHNDVPRPVHKFIMPRPVHIVSLSVIIHVYNKYILR